MPVHSPLTATSPQSPVNGGQPSLRPIRTGRASAEASRGRDETPLYTARSDAYHSATQSPVSSPASSAGSHYGTPRTGRSSATPRSIGAASQSFAAARTPKTAKAVVADVREGTHQELDIQKVKKAHAYAKMALIGVTTSLLLASFFTVAAFLPIALIVMAPLTVLALQFAYTQFRGAMTELAEAKIIGVGAADKLAAGAEEGAAETPAQSKALRRTASCPAAIDLSRGLRTPTLQSSSAPVTPVAPRADGEVPEPSVDAETFATHQKPTPALQLAEKPVRQGEIVRTLGALQQSIPELVQQREAWTRSVHERIAQCEKMSQLAEARLDHILARTDSIRARATTQTEQSVERLRQASEQLKVLVPASA